MTPDEEQKMDNQADACQHQIHLLPNALYLGKDQLTDILACCACKTLCILGRQNDKRTAQASPKAAVSNEMNCHDN